MTATATESERPERWRAAGDGEGRSWRGNVSATEKDGAEEDWERETETETEFFEWCTMSVGGNERVFELKCFFGEYCKCVTEFFWDCFWMRVFFRVLLRHVWQKKKSSLDLVFLCRKTKSIRLGFYTYKPSLIDSFFIHRNQVPWTRFLCVKTECIELGLYAWKSSIFNSISMCKNRVHWTRFVCMEIKFI